MQEGMTHVLDGGDHAGVAHAGHAAVPADVGRDTLESHDGDSAGLLGDPGLLDVGDVHDDAALEHLGEADLEVTCRGGGGRLQRSRRRRTRQRQCRAESCGVRPDHA